MKSSIFLLVLCLFVGVLSTQAQTGQGGFQRPSVEERVKRTMDRLTPELKLEGDRIKQTEAAFTDYNKAMDKIFETMQAGTPPDRSQFEKLTTERDEKLKKILTADQFKKFKEEIEPSMRQRRGGGGGGERPAQGGGTN